MIIRSLKIRMRFAYRHYLGSHMIIGQVIERFLTKRQRDFGDLHVNKHTDLIVEGFPRSGANFLTALIQNTTKLKNISYRRHCVCQIASAKRLNIPTIILLRNPLDAIASTCVATFGVISVERLLKYYSTYYRKVNDLNYGIIVCSDSIFRSHDILLQYIRKNWAEVDLENCDLATIKLDAQKKYSKTHDDVQKFEAPTPSKLKSAMKEKYYKQILNSGGYSECIDLYEKLMKKAIIQ